MKNMKNLKMNFLKNKELQLSKINKIKIRDKDINKLKI
jgi:hypothetical protein